MTEIPIKTRQRILRKARLLLSQGIELDLLSALYKSYPRFFESRGCINTIHFHPELKISRVRISKQDDINLLSDAIKELNEKVKAEAAGVRVAENK